MLTELIELGGKDSGTEVSFGLPNLAKLIWFKSTGRLILEDYYGEVVDIPIIRDIETFKNLLKGLSYVRK
jgi:hypothetical protein